VTDISAMPAMASQRENVQAPGLYLGHIVTPESLRSSKEQVSEIGWRQVGAMASVPPYSPCIHSITAVSKERRSPQNCQTQ
jgi:hypothetical protein